MIRRVPVADHLTTGWVRSTDLGATNLYQMVDELIPEDVSDADAIQHFFGLSGPSTVAFGVGGLSTDPATARVTLRMIATSSGATINTINIQDVGGRILFSSDVECVVPEVPTTQSFDLAFVHVADDLSGVRVFVTVTASTGNEVLFSAIEVDFDAAGTGNNATSLAWMRIDQETHQ